MKRLITPVRMSMTGARYRKNEEKKNWNLCCEAGTIVGEHEVLFAGTDEVIEFKHTAYSRKCVRKGALWRRQSI